MSVQAGRWTWAAVAAAVLVAAPVARADLARRRDAVVEVVQRVSPAVVHIGTESQVESRFRGRLDPLLEEFFGRPEEPAVQGLGSGVIIDPSGLIVTNEHVIRGAAAIHVTLADGRQLEAEVTGSDRDNDLAVLRVSARQPLPAARLGTSADLMIGETVVAIGSPFGLSKTVTTGVVSALDRSFKAEGRVYNDFVQTDAAINPGNSGGPLLNLDGDVIAINTAIFASAQGIGFAIPADKVRRIVEELSRYGKVRAAWVGLEVEDLTRRLAARLGWDKAHGVWVSAVEPGSPAARAGVQRGDILAEVAGSPVVDAEDYTVRVRGYPARSTFPLTLVREGRPLTLRITPVEFPARLVEGLAWERLGLRVRPGRSALTISAVRAGSPAAEVGLEPGDGLLKVNNQPVDSVDAFQEALVSARSGRSVLLLVRRGRFGYHVTLPM